MEFISVARFFIMTVSNYLSSISEIYYGFLDFINNFFINAYSNKFVTTIIYIILSIIIISDVFYLIFSLINFRKIRISKKSSYFVNKSKYKGETYVNSNSSNVDLDS